MNEETIEELQHSVQRRHANLVRQGVEHALECEDRICVKNCHLHNVSGAITEITRRIDAKSTKKKLNIQVVQGPPEPPCVTRYTNELFRALSLVHRDKDGILSNVNDVVAPSKEQIEEEREDARAQGLVGLYLVPIT